MVEYEAVNSKLAKSKWGYRICVPQWSFEWNSKPRSWQSFDKTSYALHKTNHSTPWTNSRRFRNQCGLFIHDENQILLIWRFVLLIWFTLTECPKKFQPKNVYHLGVPIFICGGFSGRIMPYAYFCHSLLLILNWSLPNVTFSHTKITFLVLKSNLKLNCDNSLLHS